MAIPSRPARGRKPIRRRPGKRIVEGKSFRLADEVRYIQRRAADHDGRIVTVGQLVLFSTETGDAWLLDPSGESVSPVLFSTLGAAKLIHIVLDNGVYDSAGGQATVSTAIDFAALALARNLGRGISCDPVAEFDRPLPERWRQLKVAPPHRRPLASMSDRDT